MYSRNIWTSLLMLVLLSRISVVATDKKDIVFLVDTSIGATSSDLDLVIDFIHKIVSLLTIGANDNLVSVVTFSSTVTEIFDLNDYTDSAGLLSALTSLKPLTPSGTDGLVSGLNYVKDNSFQRGKGARTLADDTLVVIAHSFSLNMLLTAEAGTQIYISEIHAFTVGVGDSLVQSTLDLVATNPDIDNNHSVSSASLLCSVVPILVPKLDITSSVTSADGCDVTTTTTGIPTTTTTTSTTTTTPTTTTTTTTTTPVPVPASYRECDVTTTTTGIPTTTTTTSTTTTTPTTTTTTTTTTPVPVPASYRDIIFVLDTSSGATEADLDYIIDFVYKLELFLTIGMNDTLVSIVSFSETYEEHFALDVHTTSQSVLSATLALKALNISGDPQTFQAFSYIMANSFAKGRPTAPDIVVLITFSESTSAAQTVFNAISLKTAGVGLFVVGVGELLSSDNEELVAIASTPDSFYLHHVANFTSLCDLLPTILPKLDTSTTITADVCTITTTTEAATAVSPTVQTQDDTLMIAVIAGACGTLILIVTAGFVIRHVKQRKNTMRKISVRELPGSLPSIQSTEKNRVYAIGNGGTILYNVDPKRHNSGLSDVSTKSGSPVGVISASDLPGVIDQEPYIPNHIGPDSSMVSISDPTNESDKTYDEGYRSNSIENRRSVASDNLSFSSSEKDMIGQDYAASENSLVLNSHSVSVARIQQKNTAHSDADSSCVGHDNVNSNTGHSVAESRSSVSKSATLKERHNSARRPSSSVLADAIHFDTHQTQGRDRNKYTSNSKRLVFIRQNTQISIYSRRPSVIQIEIGEV